MERSEMGPNACKLCAFLEKGGSRAAVLGVADFLRVECPVCGKAVVDEEALEAITERRVRPELVRGFIRNANRRSKGAVKVSTETVDEIVREGEARRSVSDKLNRLLLGIEDRTQFPGHAAVYAPDKDYPLAYARNADELRYLFDQLKDAELIEYDGSGPPAHAKLRAKGWERVETLRRAGGTGRQCFVAMAFGPEYNEAWNSIAKAIATAEFLPYRIDLAEHSDLIPMKLLSDIRASRFVVADITGHKRGVYLEAGFGMGLGRTVIWLCRKDDFGDAHFDVRQYNHILYGSLDEMETRLEARIRALIV